MARITMEFLICLLVSFASLFIKENHTINVKIDNFERYLNSDCIDYILTDEITPIFDYETIENYINNNFISAYIKEDGKMNFTLFIEIKKGVFYKVIEEDFYIKKGDYYGGGN